jgi:hypothetical protein
MLKASAQLHNTCALIFRKQCTPPLLFPLPLEPGILKLLLTVDLEIRFAMKLNLVISMIMETFKGNCVGRPKLGPKFAFLIFAKTNCYYMADI